MGKRNRFGGDGALADQFLQEHVGHEIEHLLASLIRQSDAHRRLDHVGFNIYLEGAYVRARTLAVFLRIEDSTGNTRDRGEDVHAGHFLEQEWPSRSEEGFPWVVLDKLVAHLGENRTKYKKHNTEGALLCVVEVLGRLLHEFNDARRAEGRAPVRPASVERLRGMVSRS